MLLNGLAIYVCLLAMTLGLAQLGDSALIIGVTVSVFAVWGTWAAVGRVRSALNVLVSSETNSSKRALAIISIPLVTVILYLMAKDIIALF